RHHRMIVAERAVAVQLFEIGEQPLDVIERMRTLGMPRQLHAIPTRVGRNGGCVGHSLAKLGSPQEARTSIASFPQMRATSARNSLSGRTRVLTSRITEKSRLFSRRSRTSVSPGLRENRA